MKKIILVMLLLASVMSLKAQTINGKKVSELNTAYCQLVGTSRAFSKKLNIKIDFGQHVKFFSSGKQDQLMDVNGKKLILNSMVDALNFMDKMGYEFATAYTTTIENENTYHFLLKKKVEKVKELEKVE